MLFCYIYTRLQIKNGNFAVEDVSCESVEKRANPVRSKMQVV